MNNLKIDCSLPEENEGKSKFNCSVKVDGRDIGKMKFNMDEEGKVSDIVTDNKEVDELIRSNPKIFEEI